jgi:tetratricopeptide (TPR) repeat protein
MKYILLSLIICIGLSGPVLGAGSPSQPSVAPEVMDYNKGVKLMLDKEFNKAEAQFRKALSRKDKFAEAHNNLAYVLRKQGPEHFDEALAHYNRAIELKPKLPEPCMYRGVLYVQMNNKNMAQKDYQTLQQMNSDLADELRYVIDNGREKEPEQFFGVSRKMK